MKQEHQAHAEAEKQKQQACAETMLSDVKSLVLDVLIIWRDCQLNCNSVEYLFVLRVFKWSTVFMSLFYLSVNDAMHNKHYYY